MTMGQGRKDATIKRPLRKKVGPAIGKGKRPIWSHCCIEQAIENCKKRHMSQRIKTT
jgi:hypothetical protein